MRTSRKAGMAMDSDRDAIQQVFGLALRQLRIQAGLSLRELGRRSLYDFSRISRVERGEHLIDPEYVPALDQALGTGGLLGLLRSLAPEPGRRRGEGFGSEDPSR